MTPADAVKILGQAVSQIETTLANHQTMQQALAVLREATAEKSEPKPKAK